MDTLFARNSLPFAAADLSDLPCSGVTFLKRVLDAGCALAPLLAAATDAPPLRLGAAWEGPPALEAPLGEGGGAPEAADAPGGETATFDAVQQLLWRTDAVRRYAATRNALRGGTCLSPHLALGCLSARSLAAELARCDAERPGAQEATGWAPGGLRFELGVCDFFRF